MMGLLNIPDLMRNNRNVRNLWDGGKDRKSELNSQNEDIGLVNWMAYMNSK